jgi:hypothetical protein
MKQRCRFTGMYAKAETVKNYSLIGRVLCKVNPQAASEIMQIVAPGPETDVKRIFFYYSRFDMNKPVENNPVNLRRIFTATMLKLYHPYFLEKGTPDVRGHLKFGFVRNVSGCFGCKSQAITRNIREVVVMYKAYPDFKEKVDMAFESLKNSN